jgi:hypothetical protein
MHLSSVYRNYPRYAMVYHTRPGSDEVEFVRCKFFKSKKAAWKWFNRKFKLPLKEFIQPEAVEVTGLSSLTVESTIMDYD